MKAAARSCLTVIRWRITWIATNRSMKLSGACVIVALKKILETSLTFDRELGKL